MRIAFVAINCVRIFLRKYFLRVLRNLICSAVNKRSYGKQYCTASKYHRTEQNDFFGRYENLRLFCASFCRCFSFTRLPNHSFKKKRLLEATTPNCSDKRPFCPQLFRQTGRWADGETYCERHNGFTVRCNFAVRQNYLKILSAVLP